MKPQNQRRNLGNNNFCKSTHTDIVEPPLKTFKPLEVDKHVLICVSGKDLFHQSQCEILEANNKVTEQFDNILRLNVDKETKFPTLEDKILKQFHGKTIRATISIFCHGSSNGICGQHFTSFYHNVLKPIREFAKQILILDGSCLSGNHMKEYLYITSLSMEILVSNEVQIYIPASCENALSSRNEGAGPFTNSLMFDLLLRRIAFPGVALVSEEISLNGVTFMKEVQNTKTFMSLPNIFQKFHKVGSCLSTKSCYSYHSPSIRVNKNDINKFDISLQSWFDPNNDDYQLIPVFRDRCEQPGQFNVKNCYMYQIYYSHVEQFLKNQEIELTYFVIDEKTFQEHTKLTLDKGRYI